MNRIRIRECDRATGVSPVSAGVAAPSGRPPALDRLDHLCCCCSCACRRSDWSNLLARDVLVRLVPVRAVVALPLLVLLFSCCVLLFTALRSDKFVRRFKAAPPQQAPFPTPRLRSSPPGLCCRSPSTSHRSSHHLGPTAGELSASSPPAYPVSHVPGYAVFLLPPASPASETLPTAFPRLTLPSAKLLLARAHSLSPSLSCPAGASTGRRLVQPLPLPLRCR